MLAIEDSPKVALLSVNTASSTEQTVVIAGGQSNFLFLVRSRRADLVPQTDTASWLSESRQTMIASESVLARDWNRPEEDAAWADL
ncbi:MAG: hypothetical protein ACREBD_36315 [Blastocatellia bacterium]